VSVPFAYSTHGNQRCEGYGTIFWDSHFVAKFRFQSGGQRSPPVTWTQLKQALKDFFKAHTETRRPLSESHLNYIRLKIPQLTSQDHQGQLVDLDLDLDPDRTVIDPDWLYESLNYSFSLWDWFFAICELVKKHLNKYWDDG
jgi:hypothetical protein